MKPVLASLALFGLAAPMASAASLDLTITNVEAATGKVMIAVFDTDEGWKTSDAVTTTSATAETGTLTVAIDGLTPGEIGIKLFHDVDGDGELDTGNFGIPSEPYGFSNDAPVRFGPPSWTAARFVIGADGAAHTIKLR